MRTAGRGVTWSFVLSFLLAVVALFELVNAGGFWNVMANSRLLGVAIRAGVVRLTDTGIGFVGSVPDAKFYVFANDFVDWTVVGVAVLVFVGVFWLKALQFHMLGRFCGVYGSFGQHARAYLYGHGVNRLLPFDVGKVASASALEGQGVPLSRAAQVVYLGGLFVVFETVTFSLYGLISQGFTRWLAEIAWPVVILVAAYLMTRGRRGSGQGLRQRLVTARHALRALSQDRGLMVRLAAMSVIAFFGVEMTVYLVSQAFTTTYVILNIKFSVLTMAVVGGYIARLVPVTPGGIGQQEWGFALPLYVGGMGMPQAVTLALLMTAFRYIVGGLLFVVLLLTRGVETDLGRVLAIFKGRARREPPPAAEPALVGEL